MAPVDARDPVLFQAQPAPAGTATPDKGHTTKYPEPRESSQGHRPSTNSSTPAWYFSFSVAILPTQCFCAGFTATVCRASLPGAKNRRTPARKLIPPPAEPPPAKRSSLPPPP